MQMAIVDFARNVLNLSDANSSEFNPNSTNQVIHLMPDQEGVENRGGTLRLGAYPCHLSKDSKSFMLYGKEDISERHRHRYEVNNDYREQLCDAGMMIVGKSPDDKIVEMIELSDHPYFIGTQAHPEFKSRPNKAHPLFKGLVRAAIDRQDA
jgi:CTP synthase